MEEKGLLSAQRTKQDIPEAVTKRTCPNCGAELGDANIFCIKCGNKID